MVLNHTPSMHSSLQSTADDVQVAFFDEMLMPSDVDCPEQLPPLVQVIDGIFKDIQEHIGQGRPPVMKLKSRTSRRSMRAIAFQGRRSGKTFTIMMRLLHVIRNLILTDVFATKRDIYYRDVALFGCQRVVDQAIEDLAFHFGVTRYELHVVRTRPTFIIKKEMIL